MLLDSFRVVRLNDLGELEGGVYWPRLQPYFIKPYFRRLTYRLLEGPPRDCKPGEVLSTRGASGVGDLDIAYVSDRCPTVMKITETGLPDYCLTLVSRGSLACQGTSVPGSFEAHQSVGLIYRGLPGITRILSPEATSPANRSRICCFIQCCRACLTTIRSDWHARRVRPLRRRCDAPRTTSARMRKSPSRCMTLRKPRGAACGACNSASGGFATSLQQLRLLRRAWRQCDEP